MEPVTLTTVDGVALAAGVTAAVAPRATVVVSHGFTATAAHPDVVELTTALTGHGFDVVTYDARGHGRSGGVCTLGDGEQHDVAAAVAHARRWRGPSAPVITTGLSMGAIATLRYARTDPALTGVVSVSSPARWRLPRNARGLFSAVLTQTAPGRTFAARRLGVRLAPRAPRPEPPIELAPLVSAPLAIVHGEDDPFIPASEARALFGAARDPRRITVVPGSWHAHHATAVPAILASVDWALAFDAAGA